MNSRERDQDASIQTALEDLLRERDIVDDAIDKLQKLLVNLRVPATWQRRAKAAGARGKKRAPSSQRKQA